MTSVVKRYWPFSTGNPLPEIFNGSLIVMSILLSGYWIGHGRGGFGAVVWRRRRLVKRRFTILIFFSSSQASPYEP
jgi:hypothetical protein